MHRLLITFFLCAFALLAWTGEVYAIGCNEDCHRRCRVTVLGQRIVEPTCHIRCEAAKKLACAAGTPLPIPVPNPLGLITDPEREICRNTYLPFYRNFVQGVITYCANWPGRADHRSAIEDAKQLLIQADLFQAGEFNGVDIRWCPLRASGMVPAAERILLHPDLRSNRVRLAVVLAHEMVHIRQFRRWPNDGFECRYGRELALGRGQGRSNSLEREAYDFEPHAEAAIMRVLNARMSMPQPTPTLPQPFQGQELSHLCGHANGACTMWNQGPVGAPCWCQTPFGAVSGQIF